MILVLLFVSLTMPLWIAWRLWRLDEPNLARWLIPVADGLVFFGLIIILARWDIAGLWTRWVLAALVLAAAAASFIRHVRRPRRPPALPLLQAHAGSLGSLVLFGAALVYVVTGLMPQADARDLAFPLEGGTFVVGQGGGNTLLNHHSGHEAQDHAVDILAVGPLGFRAAGLLPEDIADYAVTGAAVVSPCAGEVVATRDDLPDLPPPQRDPSNAIGNHVVLACNDLRVELAHLLQGSVSVAAGDRVEVGTPLALVGNSGNTTEPHLHIHAVDAATGRAVPLRFDGVTPVRNTVFER